jgi:hypothetical protein
MCGCREQSPHVPVTIVSRTYQKEGQKDKQDTQTLARKIRQERV